MEIIYERIWDLMWSEITWMPWTWKEISMGYVLGTIQNKTAHGWTTFESWANANIKSNLAIYSETVDPKFKMEIADELKINLGNMDKWQGDVCIPREWFIELNLTGESTTRKW